MAKQRAITAPNTRPIGPYSTAIESGNLLFISGQIALDATGKLIAEDVTAQTKEVLEKLKAVLSAAGLGFADVVKTTLFLTQIGDFARVNDVYRSYVHEPFPARSTIAVAALPMGAKVEIEMIAVRSAP